MHDSPSALDETPSPQLVAAWLILDTLPGERVPVRAAHRFAVGYSGPGRDGASLRASPGARWPAEDKRGRFGSLDVGEREPPAVSRL